MTRGHLAYLFFLSTRAGQTVTAAYATSRLAPFGPADFWPETALRGFKLPFSLLVSEGRADWSFEETAEGASTRVRWVYTFRLPSVLVWPVAALFLHTVFHGWMLGCLGRARREAALSGAQT